MVTSLDPTGTPIGVTISSFNTVSLHPPLALWSLSQQSSNRSAFFLGSAHVIHVLAEDQAPVAQQFASRLHNRFQGLDLELSEHKVPMLQGCSAYFECRTEACYPAGDHVIVVSRIQKYRHSERAPLVFHGSGFTRLAGNPASQDGV